MDTMSQALHKRERSEIEGGTPLSEDPRSQKRVATQCAEHCAGNIAEQRQVEVSCNAAGAEHVDGLKAAGCTEDAENVDGATAAENIDGVQDNSVHVKAADCAKDAEVRAEDAERADATETVDQPVGDAAGIAAGNVAGAECAEDAGASGSADNAGDVACVAGCTLLRRDHCWRAR